MRVRYQERMKQGSDVMKVAFSSAGRQNSRFIMLSEDKTQLMWGSSRKTAKKKSVLVSNHTNPLMIHVIALQPLFFAFKLRVLYVPVNKLSFLL